MKDTFYLLMNTSGVKRLCKRMPTIESDEIAIAITLNVPDKVFEQYIPSAIIEVPIEAAMGTRANIKVIQNFSTEELVGVEHEIVAELVTRPDCPDYISQEEETKDEGT